MRTTIAALCFALLAGCGAGLEEVDDRPVVQPPPAQSDTPTPKECLLDPTNPKCPPPPKAG